MSRASFYSQKSISRDKRERERENLHKIDSLRQTLNKQYENAINTTDKFFGNGDDYDKNRVSTRFDSIKPVETSFLTRYSHNSRNKISYFQGARGHSEDPKIEQKPVYDGTSYLMSTRISLRAALGRDANAPSFAHGTSSSDSENEILATEILKLSDKFRKGTRGRERIEISDDLFQDHESISTMEKEALNDEKRRTKRIHPIKLTRAEVAPLAVHHPANTETAKSTKSRRQTNKCTSNEAKSIKEVKLSNEVNKLEPKKNALSWKNQMVDKQQRNETVKEEKETKRRVIRNDDVEQSPTNDKTSKPEILRKKKQSLNANIRISHEAKVSPHGELNEIKQKVTNIENLPSEKKVKRGQIQFAAEEVHQDQQNRIDPLSFIDDNITLGIDTSSSDSTPIDFDVMIKNLLAESKNIEDRALLNVNDEQSNKQKNETGNFQNQNMKKQNPTNRPETEKKKRTNAQNQNTKEISPQKNEQTIKKTKIIEQNQQIQDAILQNKENQQVNETVEESKQIKNKVKTTHNRNKTIGTKPETHNTCERNPEKCSKAKNQTVEPSHVQKGKDSDLPKFQQTKQELIDINSPPVIPENILNYISSLKKAVYEDYSPDLLIKEPKQIPSKEQKTATVQRIDDHKELEKNIKTLAIKQQEKESKYDCPEVFIQSAKKEEVKNMDDNKPKGFHLSKEERQRMMEERKREDEKLLAFSFDDDDDQNNNISSDSDSFIEIEKQLNDSLISDNKEKQTIVALNESQLQDEIPNFTNLGATTILDDTLDISQYKEGEKEEQEEEEKSESSINFHFTESDGPTPNTSGLIEDASDEDSLDLKFDMGK